jgi:hypothetical protein
MERFCDFVAEEKFIEKNPYFKGKILRGKERKEYFLL